MTCPLHTAKVQHRDGGCWDCAEAVGEGPQQHLCPCRRSRSLVPGPSPALSWQCDLRWQLNDVEMFDKVTRVPLRGCP